LAQLRRSLTAAEVDVHRKQEEIEALRRQLVTPVAEVESRMDEEEEASTSAEEVATQLVPLIKTQVGVLSRFVHSATVRGSDWAQFRHRVDELIRRVAALNEGAQVDVTLVESLLADVSGAFERLGRLLDDFRPVTADAATTTMVSQRACDFSATSVHGHDSAISASFFALPLSSETDKRTDKDAVVRNEVTAKLAVFLANKYGELKEWATSPEKRREALAEALSMEIVLVAEMINLLESGDNRQRLDCAVRLQEARGVAINLSAIDRAVTVFSTSGDIHAAVADLTLNVFATFVQRVKSLVTTRGDFAAMSATTDGLFDKCSVAQQVARFLGPSVDSVTLEAQLKSHLAMVFAHLQQDNRGLTWNHCHSQEMVAFARQFVCKLGEQVGRKIDDCLAESLKESEGNMSERMRSYDHMYGLAMTYWQQLKSTAAAHNHSMQASPVSQLSVLHEAVTATVQNSLATRSVCDSRAESLAVLAVLRGVVDGFVGWSERRLSVECAEKTVADHPALYTLRGLKLPETDDVHDKLFNSLIDSVELDAIAELYEPLTRALFSQCCVDAAVKLALRSVDGESDGRNDECSGWNERSDTEMRAEQPFFEVFYFRFCLHASRSARFFLTVMFPRMR
jgi:hypothetical protein